MTVAKMHLPSPALSPTSSEDQDPSTAHALRHVTIYTSTSRARRTHTG